MSNKLKALMALALLGASSLAVAADLGDDMDTIAGNYKTVLSTNSTDTLKQSLQNMRAAALDAKQATPPKLENKAAGSPEIKDFQHGMDQLIGQIDQSLALANQGKLAEAKKIAQGFKQTRDVNHKKFR
ncbi:cytochrome B562 [Serratia plymuthica]|uniref:cytochrome b562 n=1 Tax=Serratia plymuthica TaxID=82996 RepID=UPI00079FD5EC|nr:cytochrome b562 [Serratia plymuthica]KYQ98283.1 cytochrome B562 [Serratia plymuthica]QPS86556.1 cytochrome b562 [Serratia plymuthica]